MYKLIMLVGLMFSTLHASADCRCNTNKPVKLQVGHSYQIAAPERLTNFIVCKVTIVDIVTIKGEIRAIGIIYYSDNSIRAEIWKLDGTGVTITNSDYNLVRELPSN